MDNNIFVKKINTEPKQVHSFTHPRTHPKLETARQNLSRKTLSLYKKEASLSLFWYLYIFRDHSLVQYLLMAMQDQYNDLTRDPRERIYWSSFSSFVIMSRDRDRQVMTLNQQQCQNILIQAQNIKNCLTKPNSNPFYSHSTEGTEFLRNFLMTNSTYFIGAWKLRDKFQ